MLTNKGFTAVEMMVALALASIIAVLGLVNYTQQIPRYELREAGRDLTSQLRLLRQTAVTQGQRRTITFDVDNRTYKFFDLPEQTLPGHVRFGVMPGITKNTSNRRTQLPDDGISFAGNAASFKPNGLPSRLGAIYMTNAPFRSGAMAISVSFTGRVKLFKWDGNEWKS